MARMEQEGCVLLVFVDRSRSPLILMLMRLAKLSPLLLAICGFSTSAAAGPIELDEKRDGYWIFDDVDGSVEAGNWFTRLPFLSAYGDIEDGFLAEHADDSQFIIVYSTFDLPQGVGGLYQALANDVQGIGYEHIAPLDAIIPEPYFDDTPNSQVQGFLHLNNWLNFVNGDNTINTEWTYLVFGQEIGHAWGSFVHYLGTGNETDMLGRSQAHWSFYMNAGNSPLEGHDWVDNQDSTFTAVKHDTFVYSDLDLYLMGLLPPEGVDPWFLIDNPTNCIDSALPGGECASASGHRFSADSYTVTGTRRDIDIDDVIAAEGPRLPAFGDAPTTYDIAFLLIKRPGEVLSEEDKMKLEEIVDFSTTIFEEQTRNIASINNTTKDGGTGGTTGAETGTESGTSDTGTASSDGTSDGGGSAQGSGSGGSADETGTTGAFLDPSPSGCACDAGDDAPSRGGWLGLGIFGLLGLRRRRSQRSR